MEALEHLWKRYTQSLKKVQYLTSCQFELVCEVW